MGPAGADFAIAQVRYDLWDGRVTGGGKINVDGGKKAEFTFSANPMSDSVGGFAGKFQVVDHANRNSYHLDTITSLSFSGLPTESPDASYNTATFTATGYDKDGNAISATIVIEDIQEPGKGFDTIDVTGTGMPSFGGIIDGGNFQIHPPE